ncbi:MAG: hypothetical protein MN733_28950 [Nitrososphaera sp.]|nr:hypothetical protein [Nitrososphaera sp.]
MTEDHHQRVEQMASALEDLLQMGAIRLGSGEGAKAVLSPQFSRVVSNVLSDMKIANDAGSDEIMKLMYYSLMIYLSEYLNIPRTLMMAFGNDLEKNRESMESGALITTYVSILAELWARNLHRMKKD